MYDYDRFFCTRGACVNVPRGTKSKRYDFAAFLPEVRVLACTELTIRFIRMHDIWINLNARVFPNHLNISSAPHVAIKSIISLAGLPAIPREQCDVK
jgi:hypothetical protein